MILVSVQMSSFLWKTFLKNWGPLQHLCVAVIVICCVATCYVGGRVPIQLYLGAKLVPEIPELLATCKAAARAGAEQLLAWRGRFQTREKGACDLVTDADLASEQAIRDVILSRYPDHGILGEEAPDYSALEQPYCWVVDPLDGTTNFVHDYPFYGVSIAIAHQQQLVAGVVLDPLRNECFSASKGNGAWLNDKPIRASDTAKLTDALLAVSLPPQVQPDSPDLNGFLQIVSRCQAIRRTGSAALNLAYVASGRLDGHWAHFIRPWDGAAGVILVREAGGTVSGVDGSPFDLARADYLATGTTELHEKLAGLIA